MNPAALAEADDAPAPDAPNHFLANWLARRLGYCPSFLEVLQLRAALQSRTGLPGRWAWLRRRKSTRTDPIANFLASPEGAALLAMLGGSMTALLAALATANPWEGLDGRHPVAIRNTRRNQLRDRISRNGTIPPQQHAAAALAYTAWKLGQRSADTVVENDEALEYLAPAHAAALNAMSVAEVVDAQCRLRAGRCSSAIRGAVLRELGDAGDAILARWPELAAHTSTAPGSIWPPSDGGNVSSLPGDRTTPVPMLPIP